MGRTAGVTARRALSRHSIITHPGVPDFDDDVRGVNGGLNDAGRLGHVAGEPGDGAGEGEGGWAHWPPTVPQGMRRSTHTAARLLLIAALVACALCKPGNAKWVTVGGGLTRSGGPLP